MFGIFGPRRWFAPTRKSATSQKFTPVVEALEERTMPSVLTPIQTRQAYGFNQITFTANGKTVLGDGSGQTIAIVDAYADPDLVNDVNTFDQTFGITSTQTLYQQYGANTKFLTIAQPEGTPGTDSTGLWEIEEALDVEWAHAIAPGAKILLVEAASNSLTNLLNAVKYASSQSGVVAVSMSWGTPEFAGETAYDSYFVTPTGHLGGSNGIGGADIAGGITYVAASGDSGAPGNWPAASPNVLAVGGTTLTVNSAGDYLSETAWSGSGGGTSTQETKPGYQSSVQKTAMRDLPDVSYDGDPNTGFYVYSSYPLNGSKGWFSVGGTSAGAPQWAALVAIADEGRALAGKGSLDGATQTLPTLYSLPSSDFHDITSGSNGHSATTGYDLVTGLGSPFANRIVSGLVASTVRTTAPATAKGAAPAAPPAAAATVQFVAALAPDLGQDSAILIAGSLFGNGVTLWSDPQRSQAATASAVSAAPAAWTTVPTGLLEVKGLTAEPKPAGASHDLAETQGSAASGPSASAAADASDSVPGEAPIGAVRQLLDAFFGQDGRAPGTDRDAAVLEPAPDRMMLLDLAFVLAGCAVVARKETREKKIWPNP